jgi:hypothetical protein
MAGLRDRLIHDYFGVDFELVWALSIGASPNCAPRSPAFSRPDRPGRTLPFSCPFAAPKSGKGQRAAAQSEGRNPPNSISDGARSGSVQHAAPMGA